MKKEAHFSQGPFCGGCPLNSKWHEGCFATNDAKVVQAPKPAPAPEQKRITKEVTK